MIHKQSKCCQHNDMFIKCFRSAEENGQPHISKFSKSVVQGLKCSQNSLIVDHYFSI